MRIKKTKILQAEQNIKTQKKKWRFYQSTAAQQDHEYDECLKVVVLYNSETSSPEIKPDFPTALGSVYVQEWTATVKLWNIN